MPARSYIKKRESLEKKSQVLASYTTGGDWKYLASSLNVKLSTVYRWIHEGEKPDYRGGNRPRKITDEHRNFMVTKIEQNPRITLAELANLLHSNFNISVSKECVRKHLDAVMYTLKAVRYEPEKANSPENKSKRKLFVTELLHYQSMNLPILYMDETNFNLHITRKEGRSLRGSRCTTVAAGSRGANIHLIGCISNYGLIHHEIRRGSFKKDDALAWVRQCLRRANEIYQSIVVLVLDNAPCHVSVEEILKEEEFRMHFILRLSPYTPMLNPIEKAWSCLKTSVKSKLATQMPGILNMDHTGISQSEARLRHLEDVIRDSISVITPTKCSNFFASIQNLLPSILNLEDVEF